MKVIIFNDIQNFNGSLNFINERFRRDQKRFWNYKKYIPFLIKKLKSIDNFSEEDFQLAKVYFYDGKYSSNLINHLKWSCNQRVREINEKIEIQDNMLNSIPKEGLPKSIQKSVLLPVRNVKNELEEKKQEYLSYLEKQKRNFEGQKSLLEELKDNPLIEVKTTPLKQRRGEIYQKGVDVLIATDLVHLAHTGAYDLAIILSGDTDLIEAVKLIKILGKTPVIFSYHTPGDPEKSNISDLMNAGKFINLKNLTKDEILEMSDLRENQ